MKTCMECIIASRTFTIPFFAGFFINHIHHSTLIFMDSTNTWYLNNMYTYCLNTMYLYYHVFIHKRNTLYSDHFLPIM